MISAGERPKPYALDLTATGTGLCIIYIYIYKLKGCNYVVIYSAGNKSFLLLRICTPRGSDSRSEFIVVKQARGRFIVTASNFTATKLRLGSRTSYSIKLSRNLHFYSLNVDG
jgi:hypothetical protein